MASTVASVASSLPSWAGWAVSALVALGAYLQSRRKGDIDESTLVLGAWKNLVDQHQADIRALKEEFAAYKVASTAEFTAYKAATVAETADLRERLVKAESRITELETENAGLKRAIAQNSQSAAVILGRTPLTPDPGIDDVIGRIDRAGSNSMRGKKP